MGRTYKKVPRIKKRKLTLKQEIDNSMTKDLSKKLNVNLDKMLWK